MIRPPFTSEAPVSSSTPSYIEGEGAPDTYSPGGIDIEIVGTATGGTYTLVINGVETAPIAYNHSNLASIVTAALGANVTVEVDLSFAPTASLFLAPVNGYGTLTVAIGTSSLTGSGSPEATGTYYDWTDALQPSLAISSQYVNTLTGDVWLMSKDTNNQPVAIRKTWRQISGN